jgi:hypothetical protein
LFATGMTEIKYSARIIESPLGQYRTLRAQDSALSPPLPDGPRERVNYLFILPARLE